MAFIVRKSGSEVLMKGDDGIDGIDARNDARLKRCWKA